LPLIAVAVYAVVKPVAEMVGRWMISEGTLDPKTGFLGLSMTGARFGKNGTVRSIKQQAFS
jgi:hypothetical protein